MIDIIKRIGARKILLPLFALGALALVACTPATGWPGPTVADGKLYVGSLDGRVYSLNPADASQNWVWQPRAKQAVGGFLGSCAGGSSLTAGKVYGVPTIANGVVYIGAFDGKVHAIDATTGVEKWEQDIKSPIVGGVAVGDGAVFTGSTHGTLYAIDAGSGIKKWQFPADDTVGKIWTTPAVAGGIVYFGSLDHKVYAVDATTGNLEWSFQTGGAIVAEPLIVDGVVYFGSFDSKFYALDAKTGQPRWSEPFQASNWFWGKALYSNGVIYAGSLDKNVYALNASDGARIWDAGTGGPVRVTPVISAGVLVVASDDNKVYWLDPQDGRTLVTPLSLEGTRVQSSLAASDSSVFFTTSDNRLHFLDASKKTESRISIQLSK